MSNNEIAALVALLDDENPEVAGAARGRLVALGEGALAALESAVAADEPRLRHVARAARGAILRGRADRAFAALLREGPLDVETAAIELSRTERPELDPAAVRARLDALGERVRRAAAEASDPAGRAAALGRVLAEEEGFQGNPENYYHPHNSYLDWVLDLKKGIPLSLSLVYTFVGRRAGLDVFGVAFPRHFTAAYRESGYLVYVDAFHGGRLLDRRQAETLLLPQKVSVNEAWFAPAAPLDVVRRMLANLAYAYRDRNDQVRAERIGRFLQALEARRADA
jgi:regulator of sirC expression with transglutaminase-like and TPR domain